MGMFVGMTIRSPKVNHNIQVPYYNVYLMDSGAMCHIVKDDKNMSNVMQKDKVVIVRDGRKMLSTKQRTVRIEKYWKVTSLHYQIPYMSLKWLPILSALED
jgi:hypothetical protein